MVTLSESVMKNRLKSPLAEKSRWRHILLAMKPRYLKNYASQIKSYYGTLSESHGRSFRIRHEKLPEAPPSGEITMTSYPACNETSLSRKPCFPEKIYYGTLSESHGRSFRIRHEKLPEAPPSGGNTITSYPACNKTSLSRKPCILDKQLVWNAIRKSWPLFQNLSSKIA